MRIGWVAIALGILGFVGSGPVLADGLRIGLTGSYPSTDTSPGNAGPGGAAPPPAGLDGFNIDIAEEICRRLDARCSYTSLPFRDVIAAVSTGLVDIGIANTLKTPERSRQVLFTAPYWRSTSSFIGRSGQILPETSSILASERVCAIAGSRQEAFLLTLPGATSKSVIPSPSNQRTLDSLKDGVCSLALLPTMQGLPFLQSPTGGGFAFRGLPLIDNGLGGDVHMMVNPAKPALLTRVNEAILALIRDGTHERISRRYFPFSIL